MEMTKRKNYNNLFRQISLEQAKGTISPSIATFLYYVTSSGYMRDCVFPRVETMIGRAVVRIEDMVRRIA